MREKVVGQSEGNISKRMDCIQLTGVGSISSNIDPTKSGTKNVKE